MLYALWCLQDMERIDEIEDRSKRANDLARLPFTDAGARNLNEELTAVNRELMQPASRRVGGLTFAQMRQFPGMPDYTGEIS